jgi:hypothetical protein
MTFVRFAAIAVLVLLPSCSVNGLSFCRGDTEALLTHPGGAPPSGACQP